MQVHLHEARVVKKMSDPVTNVEIEDVLSSIRRLVSEESKPRTDSAPAQPDRLVLTPAQRISETDQETPSLDDVSDDDSAPETSDTAELSDDADAQHEDDDDGGAIDLSAFIDAASVVPAQGNVQSDANDDRDESEDTPDRGEEAAEHLTLVEDAIEVEADNSDDVETVSEIADQPNDASDNSDTLEFDEYEDAEVQEDETLVETVSEDEDAVEETDEPQASLEDKIAELEAMVGESQDDWDGDEDIDDADVTSIEWRDTVEDAMTATESERSSASIIHDVEPEEARSAAWTTGEPEVEDDAYDAVLFADETTEIDEDALRDMVADIVRQELQGALGERITRNVRKLVRREIHRALASSEFE